MGNGCSCSQFWIFNQEEEKRKEYNKELESMLKIMI